MLAFNTDIDIKSWKHAMKPLNEHIDLKLRETLAEPYHITPDLSKLKLGNSISLQIILKFL